MKLVRYEAARSALAAAKSVDEVKSIRDKAMAMQVYAKQAKDRTLIADATAIRLRAERRAGELLILMRLRGERQGPGRPKKVPGAEPLLEDLKITKKQSSRWQTLSEMPSEQFDRMVEDSASRVIAEIDLVEQRTLKAENRAKIERELATKIKAMPHKRYGVIYADPPWRFEPRSRETGMDRAADNHYVTMGLAAIKAIRPPAADDCVLFLWATVPLLTAALSVMAEWGFDYRSHFVWDKGEIGTGYWNRNQHELLLIGVRGRVPGPAETDRFPSVVQAPRDKHSAKPAVFRQMIEQMFPLLPRIELFARKRVPRWDAWGAEAPAEAAE